MRRKTIVSSSVVIVLLAILVACAAPENSGTAPTSPADVESQSTAVLPQPTAEANQPPEGRGTHRPPLITAGQDVVIVYQREGGIGGQTETFVIHKDGKVEVSSRMQAQSIQSTHQATAQQVTALVNTLEEQNFFDLQPSYLPQNTCCDRMVHTITYYRNGEQKTVTTIDANPDEPAALQVVMQSLSDFLGAVQ